jgi:CRISPR-associated endonuclease Cas1
VLAHILPAEFQFSGRNRQPPRDPFNALLSLGYTILHAQVVSSLAVNGLYPWVGFYHQPRGRHAALASDLMEPFRHLVERTALNSLVQKQLKADDFYLSADQGCRLKPDALRDYIHQLWQRFDDQVVSLTSEQAETVLTHIDLQAKSLVGWIREKNEFNAWTMR